ncbi:MAG: hypothetical protein OEM02_15745, partial [Desulfobulbaceae bacterium]|nr:hypothetical protein [Desulfobulbaceae bacterium]
IVFAGHCRAYVNNRGDKFLSVIDTAKQQVVGKIELPGASLQLELSPNGETIAISYQKELKLSLLDVKTETITATVTVGENTNPDHKGRIMVHPFWSKKGDFIYIQDNINKNVVKVDSKTFSVSAKIAMPGANHDLMASENGKIIYAINGKTSKGTSLTIIDSLSDKIVSDIAVPLLEGEKGKGHHGEIDRNNTLYFCNEGGRSVTLVDLKDLKAVKNVETGKGPGHAVLSVDGKYMFIIPHKDSLVSVVDTSTREVIKNINTGDGKKLGHSAFVTNDGKFLYVINVPDQKIIKIDTNKLEVVSRVTIGKNALAFGVTSKCNDGK